MENEEIFAWEDDLMDWEFAFENLRNIGDKRPKSYRVNERNRCNRTYSY